MKKEAKKSRLLKNSLKSTDYFTPQTRRAALMPKFNNLFYARWRLLSARPPLKIAFDLLRCFSKVVSTTPLLIFPENSSDVNILRCQ